MRRLPLSFVLSLLLVCSLTSVAIGEDLNPVEPTKLEPVVSAADELEMEGSAVSSQDMSMPVFEQYFNIEPKAGFGCPSSSTFSCSEDCYAQRQSCIANCGDPNCVEICINCYRECVFTC